MEINSGIDETYRLVKSSKSEWLRSYLHRFMQLLNMVKKGEIATTNDKFSLGTNFRGQEIYEN